MRYIDGGIEVLRLSKYDDDPDLTAEERRSLEASLRKPFIESLTAEAQEICRTAEQFEIYERIKATANPEDREQIAQKQRELFRTVNDGWRGFVDKVMEDYEAIFRDMQWSRGSYHRTIGTIEDVQETHYNDFLTWKEKLTKTTNEAKKLEKENRAAHKANTKALTRVLYEGPLLSKCMRQFLEAKRTQLPATSTEPKYFEHRLNAFIALVGDKRIGAYRIADLVAFADCLQYLPERHSVDPEWQRMSVKEAIETNKKREIRADSISYTTVKINYIGKVKTAIRWLCANNKVEYPFAYDITFVPKSLKQPVTRLSLNDDQLNALFKKCASNVESKEPADVWLPLLAFFTGARLGELVTLQPENIDRRNGVYVVDLTTRISDEEGVRNRSLKTRESLRLFALHNKLVELGFIDWVERQRAAGHEYIFPELHRAKRPQHAASKRFQRLFSSKELRMGKRRHVFHSLRHTFKD